MAEVKIAAEIAASVWQIQARPGDTLAEGDTVLLLESMKMEIPVTAPRAGRLAAILVAEGEAVEEGQTVALLEA
ncbi:biotin/lipoyl-binding carrier protein [Teichococcus aestuarii]|uniref:Acetyl-CoA carboxylase biotin carboxyl carrier protein subunit n=1 Tax=Teichococcus aestuarii TaxID=568898 RepID=A0A2U1V3V1_9PROT|nr:biotin/lipoyl-binding carrier protein [Pseudoroseomonas aestuarii]PWC28572.1 acetyl-CoA carboxylase biotin carboxyl carrier protein subunit [Pseudoroseomonas aestuarii]